MINPFDIPSLWKALRNFSLTFSIVFASALLGLSVTRLLRKALGELSLHWIFLWIIPMLLIGFLAKHEHRIIRNPAFRRQMAVVLLVGAVMVHVMLTRLQRRIQPPDPPGTSRYERAATPAQKAPPVVEDSPDEATAGNAPAEAEIEETSPVRPRGPRSR